VIPFPTFLLFPPRQPFLELPRRRHQGLPPVFSRHNFLLTTFCFALLVSPGTLALCSCPKHSPRFDPFLTGCLFKKVPFWTLPFGLSSPRFQRLLAPRKSPFPPYYPRPFFFWSPVVWPPPFTSLYFRKVFPLAFLTAALRAIATSGLTSFLHSLLFFRTPPFWTRRTMHIFSFRASGRRTPSFSAFFEFFRFFSSNAFQETGGVAPPVIPPWPQPPARFLFWPSALGSSLCEVQGPMFST